MPREEVRSLLARNLCEHKLAHVLHAKKTKNKEKKIGENATLVAAPLPFIGVDVEKLITFSLVVRIGQTR